MWRSSVIVLLLAVAGMHVIAQQLEKNQPKTRTVSVRGSGTVSTVPDQVRVNIQVQTRAESATMAMTLASVKTRSILAIINTVGVDPKDVQTSRVSVSPILDYQRSIQPPPIIGYSGTNEFSVLFRGKLMESVGDFMDKAVAAGATGFGGLQYESSKQRELEREALKKAALDAQARAGVLAKELGAALGKVQSVSEIVSGSTPALRGVMMTEAATAGAPVMTGELTINAQVEVVFELQE